MIMMTVLRRFAVMWNLLTRLPRMGEFYPSEEDPEALSLAPAVGAVVGLGLGLVGCWALGEVPELLRGALLGALYALCGWSLHLDGFADLCDGVGSGRTGDAMRDVMKDSRSGAFAVMGLVLGLLVWCSACGSVDPEALPLYLALSGGLGRLSLLVCAYMGRYPWESGLGRVFVGRQGHGSVAVGVVTCLFPLWRIPAQPFLVVLGTSLLIGVIMALWMNRRMGGVNGDVLGACEVLAEVVVMTTLVAIPH